MNREKKAKKESPVRRSLLIDRLDRASAWLYCAIIHGPLGRIFTSYRSAETRWRKDSRRVGRGACRPMSSVRRTVSEVAEQGYILRGIRTLFHYLFTCPLNFYGLCGLFYSLVGVAVYLFPQLTGGDRILPISHLVLMLLVALLSLPLALSAKPLSRALGSGHFARWLFVDVLGVPKDGLLHTERQTMGVWRYAVTVLVGTSAVATWWIHPLVIPGVAILIGLLGMIFTYPETGVVLTTLTLPVLWLGPEFLILPVVIIVATWLSFLFKCLFMHRTMRWGPLETVVLIFTLLLLLSGMIGSTVTAQSVFESALWFVLLSVFFLINHLITTRAYIKRCLVGLGLSAALVVGLGVLRVFPFDGSDWIATTPGSDVVLTWVDHIFSYLMTIWQETALAVVLLFMPFLYISTIKRGRLIRYAWLATAWALIFLTVFCWGSPAVWLCLLTGVAVFAFLYSHHTLTVVMVAALPSAGITWWISALFPQAFRHTLSWLLGGIDENQTALWGSVLRMVGDHPAGIGWGEEAFTTAYAAYADSLTMTATTCHQLYLEILTVMGWQGLIVFAVMIFLFAQKMLTFVRYTGSRHDRRVLLGGLSSVMGVLLLGFVQGFLFEPGVLMAFWVVFALMSAQANVVSEACDELMVERDGNACREDRIFRMGL